MQTSTSLTDQATALATKIAEEAKLGTTDALVHRGLKIAKYLEELHCDDITLAAAILYPVFHQVPNSKTLISETLNPKITRLLIGIASMGIIESERPHQRSTEQMDKLRKMLMAMVDDIRIVLIKLAERLVNLEELKNESEEKQKSIAQNVMDIYAPLANRLGVGQLKWPLEDLSFRYLNKEAYQAISKSINMQRDQREKYIVEMIEQLTQLIKEENLEKIQVSGRAKHIYSIYRKIQRKEVDFSKIYDASALRILVPMIRDCYTVLSLVHSHWNHVPEEFDDYIANPKSNGYQSIHTVVIDAHQQPIEIQIRTYQMHEESELGVAAHWKYKEGNRNQISDADKIKCLRELMNWQKEVTQDDETFYRQVFADRIYVFTPDGDIVDLPSGATVLDFAYYIHTDVGHRCRGAKINGAISSLNHVLSTGDRVEIILGKESHPSRDWLNPLRKYLTTSVGLSKVRHWFKKQSDQQNLIDGQTLWEKAARHEHFSKEILQEIYPLFHLKSVDDLFTALGSGDIGIHTLVNRIKQETSPEKEIPDEKLFVIKKSQPHEKKLSGPEVKIKGIGDLLTQLARCCQPIPGDPIIGYISTGRGVTIHHQRCRNIKEITKNRPERVIEVYWNIDLRHKHPVNLHIEADDRPGLIRDISSVIANENITLLSLNTRVDKLKNRSHIKLTAELTDLSRLNHLLRLIQQLPDIISATRS